MPQPGKEGTCAQRFATNEQWGVFVHGCAAAAETLPQSPSLSIVAVAHRPLSPPWHCPTIDTSEKHTILGRIPRFLRKQFTILLFFLRSAHVTISYAIARCVANALIYGSKTIARYPVCKAVGLVVI